MKYTKEIIDYITETYKAKPDLETVKALAKEYEVSERSIIAKLSSLGCYKKKEYLNKRGEAPTKKEEYIERIAKLLDMNVELMESMEKVNKTVLTLMEARIKELKNET